MDEKQLQDLIERYLAGKASPEERKQVEVFLESFDPSQDELANTLLHEEDAVKRTMLPNIYRLHDEELKRRKAAVWMIPMKIAASILIVAAVGLGVYYYGFRSTQNTTNTIVDIAPGGDKAVLQLADGSTVELDSTGSTSIPKQATAVISNNNGQLAYTVLAASSETIFNKITTPRGGQYQITLSDGSKVWLNSLSSLRYPVDFNSKERIVELTGEGYFEIAKDASKPFKVTVSNIEVQVLGTHFNVMAYPEEDAIKTTLIEGSVNITTVTPSPSERAGVRLQPGQQAQLRADGKVQTIANSDAVDQAVAWRFGMFRFEDTDMKTVMRQVSRWYDVDVKYEGETENLQLLGAVSRKANVSSILRLMEMTSKIHFEIESDRITVKPGKKAKP